jgi:hypothetical protein
LAARLDGMPVSKRLFCDLDRQLDGVVRFARFQLAVFGPLASDA